MLSNSSGVTQTFDLLNRMTTYTDGTTSATYTYNPDNMRSAKTVNGTTTTHVWIGSNIALDITGSDVVSYVGNIKSDYGWYVYNANGDVVQLTDGSGNVTRYYDYDPYGNQLQDEDPTDLNPYRYSGQYFDTESGYIYLRARYYDPAIGRFISEDPAFDGFNWYVYCANNPLMYHDPSGKIAISLAALFVTFVVSACITLLAYDATHEQHLAKAVYETGNTIVNGVYEMGKKTSTALDSAIAATYAPSAAIPRERENSRVTAEVRISHDFIGGNIYGFVSDFGCGSWELATCLGGRHDNLHGLYSLCKGDQIYICNEMFEITNAQECHLEFIYAPNCLYHKKILEHMNEY